MVHCAPTRTISIFMSTDSTATSATDGNNSSFSLSTNSSTAGTFDPLAPTTAHFRATSGAPGTHNLHPQCLQHGSCTRTGERAAPCITAPERRDVEPVIPASWPLPVSPPL